MIHQQASHPLISKGEEIIDGNYRVITLFAL